MESGQPGLPERGGGEGSSGARSSADLRENPLSAPFQAGVAPSGKRDPSRLARGPPASAKLLRGLQETGVRPVHLNVTEGEAVASLIDPTGSTRWEKVVRGDLSFDKQFDGKAGVWHVELRFKGATGRYSIKLVDY